MKAHISLLSCFYCYVPAHKKSKTRGFFKVKITSNNFLIFKCMRCRKRFKARMMGSFLSEEDFNLDERRDEK